MTTWGATAWLGARLVAAAASCALVGIACWINFEATKDAGDAMTAFAIASCIVAAIGWLVVFCECVSPKKRIFFGAAVAFLTVLNLLTTIGNGASINDRARDASGEQFKAQARRNARIEELNAARAAQTAVARETPAATFAAQLRTATHWRQITALEASKAAAERRDAIDAERAALVRSATTPQRARAESQAAVVAAFVGIRQR